MASGPEIRIGCSGYRYREWRGRFYPEDVPQKKWLEYYATRFDTVELNATFYGLPSPATVDEWRERAPPGFRYAVKLSRYGTHNKKLKDPADWIGNFLGPVERLRSRLGPILVQLPPRWSANPGRLDEFLREAPRRHRWAVEMRDPSWLTPDVYRVLEDHGAALVVHDLLADHPRRLTADWVYLRMHGPDAAEGHPYRNSYSPQALSGLARRIRGHTDEGRDVFVYFNNDIGARAPADAADLRRYLDLG